MKLIWSPPGLKTAAVLTEFKLQAKIAALEDAILRRTVAEKDGMRYVSVVRLAKDPENETIHKAVDALREARACRTVEDAERIIPILDYMEARLR